MKSWGILSGIKAMYTDSDMLAQVFSDTLYK